MSNPIQEFENRLSIQFPPLFRQRLEQGNPLKSENSDFYNISDLQKKFTELKSFAGKKGIAIGDWGTEDAYVLLLIENSETELDETIYLFDKEFNQVSAFSESIETLLEDEEDFFEE